ncbi:unnamed protein product, partial [Rotaria sp. Silwood2]
MPREPIVRCCLCKDRIREGTRKYSAFGSLLLRVYVAVETKSRVGMEDCLCKRCRSTYDRWRRSMGEDFVQLDASLENDFDDDGEKSTRMELDVAAAMSDTIEDKCQPKEEDIKSETGS